jgi:hypothetical protein
VPLAQASNLYTLAVDTPAIRTVGHRRQDRRIFRQSQLPSQSPSTDLATNDRSESGLSFVISGL